MKIVSVAEIKARLSAYLVASEQGPVIVTRNGKPVAVLLSVSDEDEIERLILAYSPKLRSILSAARERLREGAGVGHDEFWRDPELDARAGKKRGTPRSKGSAPKRAGGRS